jgi:hypothetical protein
LWHSVDLLKLAAVKTSHFTHQKGVDSQLFGCRIAAGRDCDPEPRLTIYVAQAWNMEVRAFERFLF